MTIQLHGKEYVEVKDRVAAAHAEESYSMLREETFSLGGREYVRVFIDVKGKQYIGTAECKYNANPKTPDGQSPFECGETSALGRALGFAGYGVVDSIASADEVVSNERQTSGNGKVLHDLTKPGSYESHHGEAQITDQQKASIRKLYEHLGREMGEDVATMTYQQAKDVILVLSGEYAKTRERPAPQPQANGHHDLPTIKELQARCSTLCGRGQWQSMIRKALKIEDDELVLQEDDLTPDDREKIAAYLDYVDSQKKAKAGK